MIQSGHLSPSRGCQFSAVFARLDLSPLHPDAADPPGDNYHRHRHCHCLRHRHHLKPIVSPASKFHDASLLVKGEILHVHLTRGVVDGRGLPLKMMMSFAYDKKKWRSFVYYKRLQREAFI